MIKRLTILFVALVICFTTGIAEENILQINWNDPGTQELYKKVGCGGEIEPLSDIGIQLYFPNQPFDLFWDEASSSEKEKGEYGCLFNQQGNLYVYVNIVSTEAAINDAFIAELETNGATDVQRVILNGTDAVTYNQSSDTKEIKAVSIISGNRLFSVRFELSENKYVDMEKIRDVITLLIYSIKAE